MKNISKTKSLAFVLCLVLFLSVLVSCDESIAPKALETPVISVSEDGVASWTVLPKASAYVYKINGGPKTPTSIGEIQLNPDDSITVQAIGDGKLYLDSEWSEPVSYTKSKTHVKLKTPAVTVSEKGIASWTAVEGASKYAYIIDSGEPIITSENSVTLKDGRSISVKAIGGGDFLDSDYSDVQTFICTHSDSDNNQKCDNCDVKTVILIDLYAINDLHGSFMDTDSQPGVDELMTYIFDKYADEESYEILLSSGDMWQGTVESSSNKGLLMTEWMNEMDFVSMTLGNHEYDWGAEYIKTNAALAEFPFLAINITYNGETVDYCRPSVTVERGGVKIGIIGAIGNVESSISGEFNKGLEFISGKALTALVQNEAKRLREEEGCDIIVYSFHSNTEEYDYALSDKESGKGYVDVVFEGHTHTSYVNVDSYGVPHIQAGGYNQGISFAGFSFDIITGEYSLVDCNIISSSVYGNSAIEDHGSVNELYEKYFSEDDPYTAVLGRNDLKRSSSELKKLVAKLYCEFGKTNWQDYDIALAGAKLNIRNPGYLSAGEVSYAQLFQLLPFDNSIILGKIKGSDLKSKFINNSSMSCVLSTDKEINSTEYYYIVTDSYTAYYSYNNVEIVDKIKGVYARDLVALYVQNGGLCVESVPKTVGEIIADGKTDKYITSGTVIALNAQSFLLKDGDDSILVYMGQGWTPDVSVGDKLTLEGSTSFYGGLIQFTADSVYEKTGSESVEEESPAVYTGYELSELGTPFVPHLISFVGTLSISTNSSGTSVYYNVTVDGTSRVGSISYPDAHMAEKLLLLNGKKIQVIGYLTGLTGSGGRYVNVIASSVSENIY